MEKKNEDDTVLSQPATTETEENNFRLLQLEGHARVVRLTMEVCAPISKLSNKFDKKRGSGGA